MARLTQQDLHTLNTTVRHLYAHGELKTFPVQSLAALSQVVPANILGYNEVNLSRKRLVAVTDPPDTHTPNDEQIMSQYLHEQPVVTAYRRTHDGRASKISDFLTRRQFHRLTLYNEFYRQRRTEDLMAIMLPAPASLTIAYAFTRSRRNFTERDRLVLNLLRPHLIQAYTNATLATQVRQEALQLKQALEESNNGIVILTDQGCVQMMSDRARQWLQAYFGRVVRPHARRLPDDLWRWVRQQHAALATKGGMPPPRVPLVVQGEGKRLVVRMLTDQADGQILVLLEEQLTHFTPASLAPLWLSPRESEILYWIARGKTNKEVAALLGLSPHTVRTRLEDIYQKLGTKTRTAAITKVFTALGFPAAAPPSSLGI